jgi:hypothetical protein
MRPTQPNVVLTHGTRMDKVLKDPLKVTTKVDGKYPFEFKAPTYDNRSSRGISAGNYYGVGHRTPLGKESAGALDSGPIPQKAECFSPSVIFGKEDRKG